MGSYVGKANDGQKPRVVTDMYRSTEVKGENAMSKTHGSGTKKGGGKKNQYGENRTIAGR